MAKQSKRVLHLFGAMNCGGAETMLMNLYRVMNMDQLQFAFLVHSEEPGFYDDEILSRGGKIYYLRSQGQLGIVRYVLQLKRFLQKNGPFDIVHSHLDWQGGAIALAARLAGVERIIVHSHTSELFRKGLARKMVLFVQKILILLFATDFWACSQNAARFLFFRKRSVQIIVNAIEPRKYLAASPAKRENYRKIWQVNEQTLVIGHIGSINHVKNQDFLLDLAIMLKQRQINFKLIFVGAGNSSYQQQLLDKIKMHALKEQVEFFGLQKDIPGILSAFDVFCFPSKFEGLGIVVVEAQATGLPCVISTAIPKEADLQLDLCTALNLASPKEIWLTALTKPATRCTDKELIRNKLFESGYDVDESAKMVRALYLR